MNKAENSLLVVVWHSLKHPSQDHVSIFSCHVCVSILTHSSSPSHPAVWPTIPYSTSHPAALWRSLGGRRYLTLPHPCLRDRIPPYRLHRIFIVLHNTMHEFLNTQKKAIQNAFCGAPRYIHTCIHCKYMHVYTCQIEFWHFILCMFSFFFLHPFFPISFFYVISKPYLYAKVLLLFVDRTPDGSCFWNQKVTTVLR